jgi:hypothetical protein
MKAKPRKMLRISEAIDMRNTLSRASRIGSYERVEYGDDLVWIDDIESVKTSL